MLDLTLVGVAGASMVILQLILMYAKGLNAWFAGLASEVKQAIMLALNLLVAGGWYGLSSIPAVWDAIAKALGIAPPDVTPETMLGVVFAIVSIFLTNVGIQQGAYRLLREPAAVVEAKAARDEELAEG